MLSTAFSEIRVFWMTNRTLTLHQNVFFNFFFCKIGEKIKAVELNAPYIPNPVSFTS